MPPGSAADVPGHTIIHSGPERLPLETRVRLGGEESSNNPRISSQVEEPKELFEAVTVTPNQDENSATDKKDYVTTGATRADAKSQTQVINGNAIDNAPSSSNSSGSSSPTVQSGTLSDYLKQMKDLESRIKALER